MQGEHPWERSGHSTAPVQSPHCPQGREGDGDTADRAHCCWAVPRAQHSMDWQLAEGSAPLPQPFLITLWLAPLLIRLLTVEAQKRVPARIFCSLEAVIKAIRLCARGRDMDEGRDVTASLCTCCHMCLQLGHLCRVQGRVWGPQGYSIQDADKPASPTTCSCVSCCAPGISPGQQLPRTHWSSEHTALCTWNPLPSTMLSCWGSEHLPRHFADTESLQEEMQFLPAASNHSMCLPWRELIPYKRA